MKENVVYSSGGIDGMSKIQPPFGSIPKLRFLFQL